MKKCLLVVTMALGVLGSSAQSAAKLATVTFKTSAICGSCEERIESALNYSKGIVFAELDDATKNVTVKYKTKILSEQQVKEIVSQLGYKAGDLERNMESFKKLPKCCQEPGICKD